MSAGTEGEQIPEVDGHAPGEARPSASPTRLWARPTRARFYASHDRGRARRPTDVVLLFASLVGLLIVGNAASPPSEIERGLTEVAAGVPSFLDVVWLVVIGLVTVWAALLLVMALVRRRIALLRDLVLALVGATAIAALVADIVGSTTHGFWEALTSTGPPADPVSLRLALVVATAVMASPYIRRPLRRLGHWLIGLGAVSLVIVGATTPSGALLGLLCGTTAAAVVHLLFGSSAGRVSLHDVRRSLDELGVEVASLAAAELQPVGVFLVDAVGPDGRPLEVKVYGQDAWDAQLLTKAWRALWYRDVDALTLTRLQQVEHEGFVTAVAARNGVPVDEVVRAGGGSGSDALLVLRPRGQALVKGDGDGDPVVVGRMWDAVVALGAAGFAHGDLAPDRFRYDGDEVTLHGFAGASVITSDDQRRVDLAQLLVTSALVAGTDTALTVAADRLGADGLVEVLPYLQVAALGPSARAALDGSGLEIDDLRDRAAVAAGVDAPPLARLRRVTVATLVQAVLITAAAYLLISSMAGVDFQQLADVLSDAIVGLLLVALVVGQLPRFAMAFATRAECPRPIAYGPVALLHFAITFVNLVLPSTAARTTLNVRFFQRQGVPAASAMSIGVIDSLAGFAVQLFILACVLVFGIGNLDLSLDQAEGAGSGTLIAVIIVLLVVAVVVLVVAFAVPRLRRRVLERVRPWLSEITETLANLGSPARAAQVLAGNFASEVLFACTLGIVLAAFGSSASLATLLAVNVCVSLFSGIMPVPGGIGVAEGALTVGLTAAGIDEATAFAAAITYRICTYYLPPIWGGVAFRRMERAGYL